MDFPRPTRLRRPLAAMAALTLGLAAGGVCAAQGYQGQYLTWASKAPTTKASQGARPGDQPPPFRGQAHLAGWNQEAGSRAPGELDQTATPQARPFTPQTPMVQPPAPAPREAARTPLADSASRTGEVGARFYSVDRAYGLTPDPIPAPAKRGMVLIGPPDHPINLAKDDQDDRDGQGAGAKTTKHGDDGDGADGGGE